MGRTLAILAVMLVIVAVMAVSAASAMAGAGLVSASAELEVGDDQAVLVS